ncbi:MAG: hypothetical protein HY721_02080 [Planctomycetes bacterium]|nr:hypothetical protein [Planctomycetota bacterium]
MLLGEGGPPAAGVEVAAILDGAHEPAALVTTGEDGKYALLGLEPGKHRVWAWSGSWTTKWPGEEREGLSTDVRGSFRIGGLDPGAYEVRVLRAEEAFFSPGVTRSVDVGEGEARCEVPLGPGGRVAGRVVDRTAGMAAPGASVTLYRRDPSFAPGFGFRFPGVDWVPAGASRGAGGDGGFAFDALSAGSYLLHAYADGRHGWLGPVELAEGGSAEGLEVKPGGAGGLSLEVLDARTGAPVEGASAKLRLLAGPPIFLAANADTSGRAVFADVPPGEHRLEVDSRQHALALETVAVADSSIERRVLLPRASWIVVALEGGAQHPGSRVVSCLLLSEGDPGWPFASLEGARPMAVASCEPGKPEAHLKTRPGRYRVRLEARDPSGKRPTRSLEVELDVPGAGEARVGLEFAE